MKLQIRFGYGQEDNTAIHIPFYKVDTGNSKSFTIDLESFLESLTQLLIEDAMEGVPELYFYFDEDLEELNKLEEKENEEANVFDHDCTNNGFCSSESCR